MRGVLRRREGLVRGVLRREGLVRGVLRRREGLVRGVLRRGTGEGRVGGERDW